MPRPPHSSRFDHPNNIWCGWSAPRPGRFTFGKEARYPMSRRLGGPLGRSGRVRKISTPTGIRSPDRPARSESLYRLRCPCPVSFLKLFLVSLYNPQASLAY
jgi:hypothetical protein